MIDFIEITPVTALLLIAVGFVGGMVSGFIGSGGAFVLTPAMMALGVPGVVAVASNICHKFPKALVGAIKRHKYGQVDIKLGIVLGIFAEFGVLAGKYVMIHIKTTFGAVGTDLYVSAIFIVTLAIVGGFVLRDYRQLKQLDVQSGGKAQTDVTLTRLARWVRSVNIPGTMIYSKGAKASISVLFMVPIGFATGFLASAIAVGGFIGVPAMMYILGLPAIMASATELVIAFIMGLGGTIFYGLEGVVDIRLAMLILFGSLFGIQVGAIGTTYVKDYQVKFTMAVIMLTVLFSRFFYIPGYLAQLGVVKALSASQTQVLKLIGDGVLMLALLAGAYTVFSALYRGMRDHRRQQQINVENIGTVD